MNSILVYELQVAEKQHDVKKLEYMLDKAKGELRYAEVKLEHMKTMNTIEGWEKEYDD
jgi:hypothetical protein